LKVVSAPRITVKKSRSTRWRAAVLITVHLLIAAHIVQWMLTGMTVSPVEPSESMYALELGKLNAGVVFFSLAIISTLIFGRFFCGWGCHVVALQDLCNAGMIRLGVHPKPLRSRLLVWVPLGLALYMFVWPTFKREAFTPFSNWLGTELIARTIAPSSGAGALPGFVRTMGAKPPGFPGFEPHFIVDDFWATFPPWYVAIPFLLICGFATVYFLGSKGFCTYGCPYGGFFAPVDRLSIGRIVVSDACEGCGHCTAVCTSNVRVHQEVRDFGMVVDPGCMKCLDCVSVCPNQALSFSFAKPAIFAVPRTEQARVGGVSRPKFDLSIRQELWMFGLFWVLLIAFRSMLDLVPLLMAAAMAGIGVFAAWKLSSLVFQPHVRAQNLQLKHGGAIKPAGWVFAVFAGAYLAGAAWSAVVQFHLARGEHLAGVVTTPTEVAFSPAYRPEPAVGVAATRAISSLERAALPREGGIGWGHNRQVNERLAWLYACAGDLAESEVHLQRAIEQGTPSEKSVYVMAQLMASRGKGPADFRAWYQRTLAGHPGHLHVALASAAFEATQGRNAEAAKLIEGVLSSDERPEAAIVLRSAELLMQCDRSDRALAVLQRALAQRPKSAPLHAALATALLLMNQPDQAAAELRVASDLEPKNPQHLRRLAQVLRATGKPVEADEAGAKAGDLERAAAAKAN